MLFRVLRLLARQGLALRGDSVITAACETVDGNIHMSSEPDSNVHQLFEFVVGFDERLFKKKTNKYISTDIRNEMLEVMALTVLRGIVSSIRGRKFTIMVDETTDSSTKEQCIIVLRWVDNNLVPRDWSARHSSS